MEAKNNRINFSENKRIEIRSHELEYIIKTYKSISENMNSSNQFGDPSYDAFFKVFLLIGITCKARLIEKDKIKDIEMLIERDSNINSRLFKYGETII